MLSGDMAYYNTNNEIETPVRLYVDHLRAFSDQKMYTVAGKREHIATKSHMSLYYCTLCDHTVFSWRCAHHPLAFITFY